MRKTALITVAALAASVGAQSVTSPEALTNIDGVSNSNYPFSRKSARFQQTMTDLKGSPKTFKSVAVRPDGPFSCGSCTARSVDVEIIMAHTKGTTLTTTFASNYVGAPVTVFPKATVNLPARSATAGGGPAAPDYKFVFTTPFMFDGVQDFLVDIATFNNTGVGSNYYSDYASSRVYAGRTALGTGCTVTGASGPMALISYTSSEYRSGAPSFRLRWQVSKAPANAASVILLGTSDPNSPVTGACANLRSAPLTTFARTSTAGGAFDSKDSSGNWIYTPFNPAYVGAKLYTQGVSLDAGSSNAIPVALSNGMEDVLRGILKPGYRVQSFSNGAATTGGGPYNNQLVMVFGL